MQVVDFVQQRFHGGNSIALMTLNDMGRDIVRLFDCVRARVSNLLFQSRKVTSVMKRRAPPRRVNQSGIKSAICPCEANRRGFAMLPLSSSMVTA